MFGLEFLSLGLLHLTTLDVKPSLEKIECTPKKLLYIDVVSAQDDVRYDFSKKTAELNRIGKGAYSPYGEGHSNIEFRGLTEGKQSLSHNIKFYFEEYKDEGLACLQIEKVKVTINYKPTVYVSTKFEKGTPIFNKILEHEKEHVKITQRVLNKYSSIIEDRLKRELQLGGGSVGPFSIGDMAREQQELERRVRQVVVKVGREIHKESQIQHNLFDDAELDDVIEYNQGIARKLEKILRIND